MKVWQERLTYGVLSVFLAWHTLALSVAPAPDSALKQAFGGVLHPYLTVLRLDNSWDFYAPDIGSGHVFRYIVVDSARQRHTFTPTDDYDWFHPSFWWFRAWHNVIIADPNLYGDLAASLLCKKHSKLNPTSITLIQILQNDFSVEDHVSGKHPLDAEFVTENILKQITCHRE